MLKVLLVGNPNVGKSVIFSRLTGIKVIASNYPGTTIGYSKGYMKIRNEKVEIIDVPGVYTLQPTCQAEEVACKILLEGDIIINVLDATNLERHLYLTLHLLELKKPMLIVLNLWDETKHKGIYIDTQKLETILGVPVITTSAIRGIGLNELKNRILTAKISNFQPTSLDPWQDIGNIITQVQSITHRHHKFYELVDEFMIHPLGGIFSGLVILYLAFRIIRFISEGLINHLFDPFFLNVYIPFINKISSYLKSGSILHKILIGELSNDILSLKQAMGLLSTGIYVEFGIILPYIFAFYLMLSLLEDIGYLPRLAIIADNIMHRIGLHGYAIIPMLLGMGCNVPGILATRILDSKRERFIAITLISIAVPCAALQAMIIGLVGRYGQMYVFIVYFTLFIVWLVVGLTLNVLVKGFSPDLVIEIPPYRMPILTLLIKKVWFRIYNFLFEAIPYVLFGILIVNLLYISNLFNFISLFTKPVITKLWGLPQSAIVPILIGFIRKDVAVAMLGPLNLTAKQIVIGSTILAIFFPCIATFTMMIKELGIKKMFISTALMIIISLIVGALLNIIIR